ncbi:hypothetical protein Q1695_005865 [Nippostrongylus brasiliensis]|nr:hypothetical protein Q1695_005865 [Nippostrongylus brasiliensis]
MKPAHNFAVISCCEALLILVGLYFLIFSAAPKAYPLTPRTERFHGKINACLSFYELLEIHAKIVDKNFEEHSASLSLIAAYAFPDYSVITFETKDWKGEKVYCWYLDEEKRQLGPPVETRVEPEHNAYCCRRFGAHYMSISTDRTLPINNSVPIVDRTKNAPEYQLSHCLSPLHGNGPKWLLFTEFVEHYKLIGVEHFYVYVKDIDEYSARVLNDYVKTGEIETTFLRTNDRPRGLYLYATIQDCLHRSRHHSRYVIFGDLDEKIVLSGTETLSDYVTNIMTHHTNVRSIRFRPRYVLQTRDLPHYYKGDETLKDHLPTMVYHNTTPAQPELGAKCIVDPTAVMSMGIHKPILFFSNYTTFYPPVADASIRHIRSPDEFWMKKKMWRILMHVENSGLEKASECISFHNLLQYRIENERGGTNGRPSSLTPIAAYGYPSYSVVTTATSGWFGRKVYCWYKDRDGKSLGDPVESAVFPEHAVHCCKRPQAIYLGISEEEIPPISYVPITDRTAEEAKYKLSHCLTLPAGERAVWLLLAELVEYYKVLGVEYFYIYVEDIDNYSQKVLKSYVESDDAEVIRFPTDNNVDFHFAAMQECLYRSRQHSRWVAFGDINDRIITRYRSILLDVVFDTFAINADIAALRFQSNYEILQSAFPHRYNGWTGIYKHLPILNTCDAKRLTPPYGFTNVVDPNRTIAVGPHEIRLFPNYATVIVEPVIAAHSRHYVDSTPRGFDETLVNQYSSLGYTIGYHSPCFLKGRIFQNIKKRLDNVYQNGSSSFATL